MKNKTKSIAAATGLFGIALGTLVSSPTAAVAQQRPEARPERCPQDGPSGASYDGQRNERRSEYRGVSFDGPPRGGPGGPHGEGRGGPGGRGGEGREGGRPPGLPQGGQGGQAHGPMLGELLDQLNLSAAQREKAAKVLDFEREKMEALQQQQIKIQAQTRANLEAVLTVEQKQQLEKMEAQMSARNDGPPGGGRGPGGGGPSGRGGPRGGGHGGR